MILYFLQGGILNLHNILFGLLFVLSLSGCGGGSDDVYTENDETGMISLSLTGSKIDDEHITRVQLDLTRIDYRSASTPWHDLTTSDTFEYFMLDLLDFPDGGLIYQGDFNVSAGEEIELRLTFDAPTEDVSTMTTTSSLIVFEDNTTEPLYIESGTSPRFEATGSFVVPVDEQIEVIAGIDLRRSISINENGHHILDPAIRVVSRLGSGTLKGEMTNMSNDLDYAVYAYVKGDWDPDEVGDFSHAVNSVLVEDMNSTTNEYALYYLPTDTYDLVIDAHDGDAHNLYFKQDVLIENKIYIIDLDISTLSQERHNTIN